MPDPKRVEFKVSKAGYEWLVEKAAALSTEQAKLDMSDVIRAALDAYAGGAVDFSVPQHGGPRPGSGRKPKA